MMNNEDEEEDNDCIPATTTGKRRTRTRMKKQQYYMIPILIDLVLKSDLDQLFSSNIAQFIPRLLHGIVWDCAQA